ncbi:hypothetical protein FOZ62_021858 [Perkinsus olseni]|uniref:NAD(P)-binding domain-containing protein n=2 Tax=Perkinsus olseni TaxID=32597 RepID=A0A7J6TJ84_PEROL|nr:hypothetical protein FOZ62_021858 [Perkinsus olseni]
MDVKALRAAMEGVTGVIHLAAASKQVLPSLKNSTMATFNVNVNSVGTANVLEVAQQASTVRKVIFAASSTFYGNQDLPYRETDHFSRSQVPSFMMPKLWRTLSTWMAETSRVECVDRLGETWAEAEPPSRFGRVVVNQRWRSYQRWDDKDRENLVALVRADEKSWRYIQEEHFPGFFIVKAYTD